MHLLYIRVHKHIYIGPGGGNGMAMEQKGYIYIEIAGIDWEVYTVKDAHKKC